MGGLSSTPNPVFLDSDIDSSLEWPNSSHICEVRFVNYHSHHQGVGNTRVAFLTGRVDASTDVATWRPEMDRRHRKVGSACPVHTDIDGE